MFAAHQSGGSPSHLQQRRGLRWSVLAALMVNTATWLTLIVWFGH